MGIGFSFRVELRFLLSIFLICREMNRIILVRYDEIALKSRPVRTRFEGILVQNIESALGGIDIDLSRERGRIYVETSDWKEATKRLTKVPGVASASPARRTDSTPSQIRSIAVEEAEKSFGGEGTFAVRSRRTGKQDFTSQELNEEIGAEILRVIPDLSVDLDNPDQELFVEVRNRDAYVFTDVVRGVGGLPVGSQEKAAAIFSDDFFSPLATFLMLKRGCQVHPIFFNVSPNEEGRKVRAIEAAKKLVGFYPELELRVIPFSPILRRIGRKIPERFEYMICKRLILRLAEMVSNRVGAKVIVANGKEGRSQGGTLMDLATVEEAVQTPILRPLIGMEEEKVKKIAQEIGISKASSRPLTPCWEARFTEAISLEEVKRVEGSFSFEDLLKRALEGMEICELEDPYGPSRRTE